MYAEFYGLREKPFALSPDPRYLFLADSHREALAHLLYGIEHGEGFISITGEVGTGKTTLCRTLLQRIEPGTEVAFIFNPQLSAEELLQAINAELGLATEGLGRRQLMEQLNRFLLAKKADGRRVLLLIDEAQNLAPDTLEQVRLLSNLETDTSKLIQIILIGQPELDAILESPNLRQLRQRISVRWRLSPLSAIETRDYVRHRLRISAGAPREIFTELALRELHRRARGIPRLVNLLADRALLAGYAAGARTIGLGLVTQSDKEIRGSARSFATSQSASRLVSWLPSGLRQVAGAALLVALGIGAAAAWQRLAAPPAGAPESAAPEAASPQPTLDRVGDAEPAPAAPAPELTAAEEAMPTPLVDGPAAGEPMPLEVASATGDVAAAPPAALPATAVPTPPVVQPLALEDALAAASPAAATSDSVRDLLRRWGAPDDVAPFLTIDLALERLRGAEIAVLTLRDANRATLELFNHASLLQLRALDGAPRTVLLVGLEGDRATLVGLRGGDELSVPWTDVEEHWTGELVVAWRDFAGLPEMIGPGIGTAGVPWLQSTLQTLGFLAEGDRSGVYDAATASAVREFQRSRHLTADGTVGPLTKAMLYEALPDFAIPRLGARPNQEVG
ncbi:MAG TPA: AAA family ATPase [Myxococcota bacterium]|nr:AAA family ATPase [Myxococcota bacterium]